MSITTWRRVTITTTAVVVTAAALVTAPAAVAAAPQYTGVVVSPSGVPVPDVYLTAGEDVPVSGHTDVNGRFRLPALGFPHVYLCARLAQDAPQGGAAGWYDACAQVEPGTDVKLRFQPGAAVGGVVVDVRSGRPLAGASVGVWDNNQSFAYRVTTDANGHYRYRNLRPGANLAPAGVSAGPTATAPYGYGDVHADTSTTQITLRAGEVRNDSGIQAAPLVKYSGTVVDGVGTPLGGARVAVETYRSSDQEPRAAAASVVTDVYGAWTALRPWSGVADVCAWGPATRANPTGLALSCTVARSRASDVTAPSTLGDPGGALSGKVTAPGGTPGSNRGIQVSVGVPMSDGGTFWLPGVVRGGTATVASLPTGIYRARLSVEDPHSTDTAVGYSQPQTVGPTRTATFPAVVLQLGD